MRRLALISFVVLFALPLSLPAQSASGRRGVTAEDNFGFGRTAEVVFLPRGNHNLTRTGEPRHLIESMNWRRYWFDRYLNGNASAVPPTGRR